MIDLKNLTVAQLESLNFEGSSHVVLINSVFESHIIPDRDDNDTFSFESWCAGSATIKSDCGVELDFNWIASGGSATYQNAFEFEIDQDTTNSPCVLKGAVIVDEDGEVVDGWMLADILHDYLEGREWESEVRLLLPEIELEEIEIDESTNMNTYTEYTVERDNDRTIKFMGELVGSVSSSDEQAMGSLYSGSVGRWTELKLYTTKSGKYICSQIGRTRHQGERVRYSGAICDTTEQVIEFFGNGWLAKLLYDNAKIDGSIYID